jgi:hypothetical protein
MRFTNTETRKKHGAPGVDGQPAQVLDENNRAWDFEILHESTATNPPFQVEYGNDHPQ